MGRRVHVKADDVLDLLGKGRVVGALEGADAVRLQAVGLPEALHRAQGDADGLGHRSAGPVGRLARRLRAGQRQHLRHGRRGQRWLAGRPRLVTQQAVHTFFGVAPLPAPDRRPAHPGTARHFGNRQPVRRKNNDPGPLDVLVPAVALADHRRQPRAVFGPHDHANILCHGRRIARPNALVNHSFVSVH